MEPTLMPDSSETDLEQLVSKALDLYISGGYGTSIDDDKFVDFFPKYETAHNFYKDSNFAIETIPGHLKGINFNFSVEIKPLPPPEAVQQMQLNSLDDKQKPNSQGTYYSNFGVTPSALGINPQAQRWNPELKSIEGEVLNKKPYAYDIKTTEPISALVSTAATIMDTWSTKDPYPTKGGGQQIFCANKEAFVLNSKKTLEIQTPSRRGAVAAQPVDSYSKIQANVASKAVAEAALEALQSDVQNKEVSTAPRFGGRN
jgi:hypothetical protein